MSKKAEGVRRPSPAKPVIPNWLIVVVIVWVLVMWSASTVYSIHEPKWPVPASVHAAVPVVLTGVMGYLALRGRANGSRNGE